MLKRLAGAVATAFLFCASSAQATDYRLDFEVSNFTYVVPGEQVEAPFASASGYAVFSADFLHSEWTAIKDFSFVVGDQRYTLADIEFQGFGYGARISGLPNGTDYVEGTNDFQLDLYPAVSNAIYATAGTTGLWTSSDFTQTYTQLPLAAVPEAETYAMFLAGLGLLGAVARRRKA